MDPYVTKFEKRPFMILTLLDVQTIIVACVGTEQYAFEKC